MTEMTEPRQAEMGTTGWNPYDRSIQFDPYPSFRWLRDEAPVYRNEAMGFYVLSRFDDVVAAHLDVATFISGQGTTIEGLDAGMEILVTKDAPEHGWHRRLVSRAFTSREIGRLEPLIRDIAGRLLDEAADVGELDAVEGYSARLPLLVISELIGIPPSARDAIHDLSRKFLTREPGAPDGKLPKANLAVLSELVGLVAGIVADRRAHLGDDVLSTLISTPVIDDDGNETFLTDEKLAGRFLELAVAGHETGSRLVASGIVALHWYRDQRQQLIDEPSLFPNAVEEMLRWDPPTQYAGRVTTRDVELHGVTIPEGSRVVLLTAAAAHDERVYDEPELFWIHRRIDRQLGFGWGPHMCLGAPLARLEARIAFEQLLRRFPGYEIDESRVVRLYGSTFRGLSSLPIVLAPVAA